MRELWRFIPGWPNYEVSNLGRIKSTSGWRVHNRYPNKMMWWKGKMLKPGKQKSGHLFVVLTGQKAQRVHRLVALAFMGPPPFESANVRHLDDDPTNNVLSNLAWGTQLENAKDAKRNGRIPRGEARSNSKLFSRDIPAIRASKESVAKLALRYKVAPATIRDVKVGKSWGHI